MWNLLLNIYLPFAIGFEVSTTKSPKKSVVDLDAFVETESKSEDDHAFVSERELSSELLGPWERGKLWATEGEGPDISAFPRESRSNNMSAFPAEVCTACQKS